VASGVDNAHSMPLRVAPEVRTCVRVRSTSAFPANGYISSNFWVDVVFNTVSAGVSPLSQHDSLPNATQSPAYIRASQLSAAPHRIVVNLSGTLPSALTLSPDGQLSGTPTILGTSTFMCR